MKKRWMSMLLVLILALSAFTLVSCTSGQEDAAASESASTPATNETGGEATAETGTDTAEPASEPASASDEETAVGLTSFTTTDLEGNTVTQDIFADYDLTMVNIWATFCSPCINEMPELGELKAEMEDKGVNIVGIVVDVQQSDGSISEDMVATAKDIVEQTGADYTHLLPSDSLNNALLYGVSAVPTTVFVDSQGNIVGDAYVGSRDKAGWQEIINGLLAE
jgi:thiol-disulfide isomerase/thioredoxin